MTSELCTTRAWWSGSRRPARVADGAAPALGPELFGGGVGEDAPPGQHDHPVGQLVGLFEVVGGDQHGGPGRGQVLHGRPGPPAGLGVQAGGGLVQEQQLGPADDAQGDVDPAAPAARQGADPGPGLAGEAEQLQDLGHGPGVGVQPGEDSQQLADG